MCGIDLNTCTTPTLLAKAMLGMEIGFTIKHGTNQKGGQKVSRIAYYWPVSDEGAAMLELMVNTLGEGGEIGTETRAAPPLVDDNRCRDRPRSRFQNIAARRIESVPMIENAVDDEYVLATHAFIGAHDNAGCAQGDAGIAIPRQPQKFDRQHLVECIRFEGAVAREIEPRVGNDVADGIHDKPSSCAMRRAAST